MKMKEKLRVLFIPIAVILSTVSWGAVVDKKLSAFYTVAAITPVLTVIAAAFAMDLAKKLKVKTALLVNGVAFAVSVVVYLTGIIIDEALLCAASGCAGLISAIGFFAFGARLWKSKRPDSYKIALRIAAGVSCVLCFIVIFSGIRFYAGYISHNNHKRFAWAIMLGIVILFGALSACFLVCVKRLGTEKNTRRLAIAVALMLCGVLAISSVVAVYYSPQIKVTTVYRAQIGFVALGISGKDAVCIYDCNGAKAYLVRREASMNFRDTFEECDLDFYTRMVDGVKCKMEDKGFMHFFRVLSFTPVKE